jgi:hypothetical protein
MPHVLVNTEKKYTCIHEKPMHIYECIHTYIHTGGMGVVARKLGLRLQGPGSRSALRRAGFFAEGITNSES